MPVPINNSRPSLPYAPTQSLPNNTRFGILTTTQRPPTAEMLDAEFNALTDDVNMLAAAINDVQAGSIPGANNPLNANKVLKTDGANHLSWTLVTNAEIAPGAVVEQGLGLQSVTTPKIGDGAVTAPKIFPDAVTAVAVQNASLPLTKLSAITPGSAVVSGADGAPHALQATLNQVLIGQGNTSPIFELLTDANIEPLGIGTPSLNDRCVTTAKISDAAVTTQQLADAAVTNPKIGLLAVTAPQISSAGSNLGDVLTSDGAGAASFLANVGKVLQIVSYEDARFSPNEYDAAASPTNPRSFKTAPFLLKITPRKTNSKIILFYSINVGGYPGSYTSVTLCKNNLPFKVGQGEPTPGYKGVTHSGPYLDTQYGCYNFSSLFIDTGVLGTEIAYEIKKAQPYVGINSGYSGGYATVSTMHAIEIDI